MKTLLYRDLGETDFASALALQEQILERKQREAFPDVLLLVEHPHVYTIGRSGRAAHVIEAGDVPVIRTSRGGDVTYHGPGQLVAYPIVDLRSKLRKAVHGYLYSLELAILGTLKSFGLKAKRRPPWTGIWIEERKIAAIGVAVKRSVTYHGLALNVRTDLGYFRRIVPCGLVWAGVTSIEKELGREVSTKEVKEEFVRQFLRRFEYTKLEELCHASTQSGSGPDSREAPITFA